LIELSREERVASEEQWRAISSKDSRYDGVFVYGVRSTGIYCKPSCVARRPGRDKIVVFANPEEAERAGFRACLRCLPRFPVNGSRKKIEELCIYIKAHPTDELTLKNLSRRAEISPYHLHRTFKRIVGITPRQYVEFVRLKRLKHLLRNGESVRKSTYHAGYDSASWLYSDRYSKLGMDASEYRSGGQGMEIQYAVTSCSLGYLIVAGTQKGICFVGLSESEENLKRGLKGEYPRAMIRENPNTIAPWINAVTAYIDGEMHSKLEGLPLDIKATAFQWKVWKYLRSIPQGTTTSYGEIAQNIAAPQAARAVAKACATNPVALIIPCHRVVRANGELGGYRWGIKRKRSLLLKEGALSAVSGR
jgi:AraC family transcriptional regulator of adaptative response/methylated-DNA-[protein]-cysteine methyltransferase